MANVMSSTPADVTIDGSMGEGGGQVLRTSIALAALLSRSLRVTNIRAARPNPGLRAQHLSCVKAVASLANATVHGSSVSSRDLRLSEFGLHPGSCGSVDRFLEPLVVHTQTAGSCALVLQAALPVALKCRQSGPVLTLTGGTIAMAAPHADYIEQVLRPNLALFGIDLEYRIERHGFFPRGGALVHVAVKKSTYLPTSHVSGKFMLRPISLTSRGEILEICGRVVVAGKIGDDVGVSMASTARKHLRSRMRKEHAYTGDVRITMDRLQTPGQSGDCAAITVWARVAVRLEDGNAATTVLGSSGLFDRRAPGTPVEIEAVDELCEALQSNACVDSHMADQLIIFMGMAEGKSRLLVPRPTLHMTTVVDVLRAFDVRIDMVPSGMDGSVVVSCDGLGISLPP